MLISTIGSILQTPITAHWTIAPVVHSTYHHRQEQPHCSRSSTALVCPVYYIIWFNFIPITSTNVHNSVPQHPGRCRRRCRACTRLTTVLHCAIRGLASVCCSSWFVAIMHVLCKVKEMWGNQSYACNLSWQYCTTIIDIDGIYVQ